MNNFRKLNIWKKAVQLATDIYISTYNYPREEQYGIVSQMRRSAISISSNVAEGSGRKSNKEFGRFLLIAYGSACELETQLIISKNLDFVDQKQFDQLFNQIEELQKMIYTLNKNLSE